VNSTKDTRWATSISTIVIAEVDIPTLVLAAPNGLLSRRVNVIFFVF
jgi:hypothetical protein